MVNQAHRKVVRSATESRVRVAPPKLLLSLQAVQRHPRASCAGMHPHLRGSMKTWSFRVSLMARDKARLRSHARRAASHVAIRVAALIPDDRHLVGDLTFAVVEYPAEPGRPGEKVYCFVLHHAA